MALIMKRLTEYKKNGYEFTVITRRGNIAVFSGINSDNHITYECIIIQSHDGREIQGKHFEASEYAPSNNQWGVYGWTHKTQDGALDKMRSLALAEDVKRKLELKNLK